MKKKRIIRICEIAILVIFVLLYIEDASIYTIGKNSIDKVAISSAENNGMKNAAVVKKSDQGSSIVVVLKNEGQYGFAAFSKSNLYGYYRISKSYFHSNSDKEIHTVITDANNMYLLSLYRTQEDINVLVEDKQTRWKDRLTNLGIITFIILGVSLFRSGLKRSSES